MKTIAALLLATFIALPTFAADTECLPMESAVCVQEVNVEALLERIKDATEKSEDATERMEDLIERLDTLVTK